MIAKAKAAKRPRRRGGHGGEKAEGGGRRADSAGPLLHGDCRQLMRAMPAASVDAIVTDPPYGIRFMGQPWDDPDVCKLVAVDQASAKRRGKPHGGCIGSPATKAGLYDLSRSGLLSFQCWCVEWAAEALRVAKPGAHLLVSGGTRTFHRLACGLEDAGWEVRDCIMWVYGSGFPKSLDVSKAIDKAAGARRERIRGVRSGMVNATYAQDAWSKEFKDSVLSGVAVTDAAKLWQGWGTAIKPAWEPILVCRRPLDGTVAHNVLAHGTGGLNIDGCRIGTTKRVPGSIGPLTGTMRNIYGGGRGTQAEHHSGHNPNLGRWPANLIHDGSEEVLTLFPPTANGRPGPIDPRPTRANGQTYGLKDYAAFHRSGAHHGDSGSAARFFYCAKASRRERGEGNSHPTVKSLALMRYLVRLVTPPGGLVLDPFLGSGTTALAAALEGFRFLGIEQDRKYLAVARRRLNAHANH